MVLSTNLAQLSATAVRHLVTGAQSQKILLVLLRPFNLRAYAGRLEGLPEMPATPRFSLQWGG